MIIIIWENDGHYEIIQRGRNMKTMIEYNSKDNFKLQLHNTNETRDLLERKVN